MCRVSWLPRLPLSLLLVPLMVAAVPARTIPQETDPVPAGWVVYREDLASLLDAPWLDEGQRERVRIYHESLKALAELHAGHVPPDLLHVAREFVARFADRRREWEALRGHVLYEACVKRGKELRAGLAKSWEQALARIPKELPAQSSRAFAERIGAARKLALSVHLLPPWVVAVEADPGWDELAMARSLVEELEIVAAALARELGFARRPVAARPLAVVLLRSGLSFRRLSFGGRGSFTVGASAYHDPSQDQLVVLESAKPGARAGHAVDLLLERWCRTPVRDRPDLRSWVRAGLVHLFSGASRSPRNADGAWRWTFGGIGDRQVRSLAHVRFGAGAAEGPDLSRITRSRHSLARLTAGPMVVREGIYRGVLPPLGFWAQPGWLLRFLRDFDVDDRGSVRIVRGPAPPSGRYADAYRRLLASLLMGDAGEDAFRAALGLDRPEVVEAGSESFRSYVSEQDLREQFRAWLRWVERKARMRQMKDGFFVPGSEWRNRRGELGGKKEDDLLHPRRGR